MVMKKQLKNLSREKTQTRKQQYKETENKIKVGHGVQLDLWIQVARSQSRLDLLHELRFIIVLVRHVKTSERTQTKKQHKNQERKVPDHSQAVRSGGTTGHITKNLGTLSNGQFRKSQKQALVTFTFRPSQTGKRKHSKIDWVTDKESCNPLKYLVRKESKNTK